MPERLVASTTRKSGLFVRLVLAAVIGLLLFVSGVWGALALWYRLPGGKLARGAGCFVWSALVLTLLASTVILGIWLPLGIYLLALVTLVLWWVSIKPSHDQVWADDVACLLHGTVDDGRVTLTNVRDFSWRSVTDYDAHWVTRQYDLQQLRSADVVISYWDFQSIAHVMVSFDFTDGRHLAFSVEIRRRRGDAYSAIGGFFRQFETILVAASESDIIRLRTDVRKEDVYLYPLRLDRATLRELFVSYVSAANRLVEHPAFYNTATSNCTTIVYRMARRIGRGLRWDPRLLLTGYLADYLYEIGALDRSVSLDELRRRGRVTGRERNGSTEDDYSREIRIDVRGDARA